jgi:hypothetical protein
LGPDKGAKLPIVAFPWQQRTLCIADCYIYSNKKKKNHLFHGNNVRVVLLTVTSTPTKQKEISFPWKQCTLYIADCYIYSNNNKKELSFPWKQCTLYIAITSTATTIRRTMVSMETMYDLYCYYIYSNNNKKNYRFRGNMLTRMPLDITLYVLCVSCLVVFSGLNSTQYSRKAKEFHCEI